MHSHVDLNMSATHLSEQNRVMTISILSYSQMCKTTLRRLLVQMKISARELPPPVHAQINFFLIHHIKHSKLVQQMSFLGSGAKTTTKTRLHS